MVSNSMTRYTYVSTLPPIAISFAANSFVYVSILSHNQKDSSYVLIAFVSFKGISTVRGF